MSFRQAITPAAMQGRMNATMRFIVWGTIPVGAILGGTLATAFGLHEAIWIGAIGSILAVVPLLITPVHTLKTMPEPVDAAPVSDGSEGGASVAASTPGPVAGGLEPFAADPIADVPSDAPGPLQR